MAATVGDSQDSSSATTDKTYLILLRNQRLSTKGKIVSKYCNISKPAQWWGYEFACTSEG